MTSLRRSSINKMSGIVERHVDLLAGELRLGNDEQKMRSAAFVFLVARTAFDFTDREAFEGNTDPTLATALRSRRTGSQR